MSIIRVAARGQYLVMDQQAAADLSLSWEAKGLHVYLLSRPDDWKVSPDHLAHNGTAGRDKVYRMLKELIEHGYAKREAIRDESGRIVDHEYLIYETPLTAFQEVDACKPLPENTEVESGSPLTENQEVDNAPCETAANPPLPEKPDTEKPDTAFQDALPNTDINLVLNKPRTPQQQACARGQKHEAQNVPRKTSEPFAMFLDWLPDPDRFRDMLLRAGVPPNSPWIENWSEALPEFLLFWLGRSDQCRQTQWEGKFLRQVQFNMRQAECRPELVAMTSDWVPSDSAWVLLVDHWVDIGFAERQLAEFRLYWLDAGGRHASWNTKFIAWVRQRWTSRTPTGAYNEFSNRPAAGGAYG